MKVIPANPFPAGSHGRGWTNERIAALKAHWLLGLSASQVAKELGGVTRNAVIGKLHRLGLTKDDRPQVERRAGTVTVSRRKASNAARGAVQRIAKTKPQPTIPRLIWGSGEVCEPTAPQFLPNARPEETVAPHAMCAHNCQWPFGDPQDEDFAYCGRKRASPAPYCAEHVAAAYQPQTKAKTTRADGRALYLAEKYG